MNIATIKVNAVTASVERQEPVPRGLVGGTVTIHYEDPIWNELNKTAVFRGAVTRDVLNVSEVVEIPWETVENAGKTLYIGFYGCSEDGTVVVPTIWAELGRIQGAADPSGDISADPSPDVWGQIQSLIGNLSRLDTENKDTIVDAVNETLAQGGADPSEVKAIVEACLKDIGTGADVYLLGEGETLADAPERADVVIDPNGASDEGQLQTLIVTLAENADGTFTASHSASEILSVVEAGGNAVVITGDDGLITKLPVVLVAEFIAVFAFSTATENGVGCIMASIDNEKVATFSDETYSAFPNPKALTINGTSYKGDAPVDMTEAVNALIDTKLGVIENGAY